MAELRFTINVRHNAARAAQDVEETSGTLTRAMRDFAEDGAKLLKRDIAGTIEDIAGGVYWDILGGEVVETQNGARVLIRTPRSKPHPITPHGPYPLRFKGRDGTWVSTHHVDHPGSNPPRWDESMQRETHPEYGRLFSTKVREAVGIRSAMPPGL